MKNILVPLHAILIIAAYTSPFWLDFRYIMAAVVLYWLQLAVFQHCVLSTAQFGDKETTFHEWYLAKIGIRPAHRTFKYILNVWVPIVLLALALVLQIALHVRPLVAI